MKNAIRLSEYKVLGYRILLVFIFYFIARVLFLIYNFKLLQVDSVLDFLSLAYHGLAFDTTAILYVNALFVLFSILPFVVNTKKGYQKFLSVLYFVPNLLAYATNFVDFIYYKYTYARTTLSSLEVIENENNKGDMFFRFIISYWHVYLLFIVCSFLWVYLYRRVKVEALPLTNKFRYFGYSILGIVVVGILMIGGIRGDFKKSTRPINMVDANRYVKKSAHGDIVLNTPFAIIRTLGKTSFKKVEFVSDDFIDLNVYPIKQYANNMLTKPNIVLFITESFGREYWGSMNRDRNIPNFKSYTPFLDSLSNHSLIFPNAFANGTKSIHGMGAVLAGIPSFKEAFTSSPYAKQDIQSLVSILKEEGYDTSFFHGAPNGSMGFLGFANILGFDHYYGKTEYHNDADFDGSWGIWDEPFMQFMKQTLDNKQDPFFSTIFTVSSHEPYVIPEKYKGKFPEGDLPIHKCVGYTDYAFRKFFEAAAKEDWFHNTLFIITADHTNQIHYEEYLKSMNRTAVPILFYKYGSDLVGVNNELAQQIDIYPTVLDLIGYKKPFRSWGRSLMGDTNVSPFVINYLGSQYNFMKGNYICAFDGKKAIGFYDIEDNGLIHNLIDNRNAEMDQLENTCKAFIQDYFERIIDRKL